MKVLITGSTQGIGKAIAERLSREKNEVIIHCTKDIDKARMIQRETGSSGAVAADLSNAEETKQLFFRTGAVDCLILNASVQYKNNWLNITDEEIEKQLTVNVVSTLKLIQAYYPAMKKKGFGRIITIGSTNQYRNHPELSLYAATKCAVASLVRNIAKQIAPFGVTINNVAPGAIITPRNQFVYEDETMRKEVEKGIPLGRFGKPEEIAGIISMLIGKDGTYITGADIVADGGMRL